MKQVICALFVVLASLGNTCGPPRDPLFVAINYRSTTVDLHVQTADGTFDINLLPFGGSGYGSATRTVRPGQITVKASITNESVSPTITFTAQKCMLHYVNVKAGQVPTLEVSTSSQDFDGSRPSSC